MKPDEWKGWLILAGIFIVVFLLKKSVSKFKHLSPEEIHYKGKRLREEALKYRLMGNFDQAYSNYWEAFRLYHKIGSKDDLCNVLCSLAETTPNTSEIPKIIGELRKVCESYTDGELRIRALNNLESLKERLRTQRGIIISKPISQNKESNASTMNDKTPQIPELPDKIVPFVGAGISIASGLPGWYDFKNLLLTSFLNSFDLKEWPFSVQPLDFLKKFIGRLNRPEVTMQFFNDVDNGSLLKCLEIFKIGKFNDNHYAIAQAAEMGKIPFVITTNFDTFIEDALNKKSINCKVISNSSQAKQCFEEIKAGSVPSTKTNTVIIFKIHGTVDNNDGIITTLSDSSKYLNKDKFNLLQLIFSKYKILFAGYAGNDDDIYPAVYDCADMSKGFIWLLRPKDEVGDRINNLIKKSKNESYIIEYDLNRFIPKYFADSNIETEILKQNIIISKDVFNRISVYHKYAILGRLLAETGFPEEAIKCYEICYSIDKANNWLYYFKYNGLADIYFFKQNYSKAESILTESLKIINDLKNINSSEKANAIMKTALNLFNIYLKKNNIQEASNNLDLSKKYLDLVDNKLLIVDYYFKCGVLKNKLNDPDTALDCFQNALDISKNEGLLRLSANALNSIAGIYYFHKQDYKRAITFMEEAIYFYERTDSIVGQLTCKKRLAEIYTLQGNDQDANKVWKQIRALEETNLDSQYVNSDR